jgi:hypothetical protein
VITKVLFEETFISNLSAVLDSGLERTSICFTANGSVKELDIGSIS